MRPALSDALFYAAAALAEVAGCYGVWAWSRLGRPAVWLLPAVLCLVLFAWLLTRIDSATAGRAFAAYGGVYIAASLLWLATVERTPPDRWDLLGALLCLAGSTLILWTHRP